MDIQTREEQDRQSNSVVNQDVSTEGEIDSGLELNDNRPLAVAQRKQKNSIGNSSIIRDKKRFLDLIDNYSIRPFPIQKRHSRDILKTGIESTSNMTLDGVKRLHGGDQVASGQAMIDMSGRQGGTIQRIIGNHGKSIIGRKVKHNAKLEPEKKDEKHLYQNLVVESVIGFENGQYIYSVSNNDIGYRVAASDLEWDLLDGVDQETINKQLPPSLWDAMQATAGVVLSINIAGFLMNCFKPKGRSQAEVVQDLEVKIATNIVNQFLKRIGISKEVDEKNTSVKFYSGQEWKKELSRSLRKGESTNPEDVEGFELNDRISINQNSHTVGTIVHEMLHRVSNCAYGREFWEEAMTEYFTQLALSVDARFSSDNKHSPYIANVKLLKRLIKANKLTHDEIVAIYFRGDRKVASKMRKLIDDKS